MKRIMDRLFTCDRKLREIFAGTLVQVEDELTRKTRKTVRLNAENIASINRGEEFMGIDLWEKVRRGNSSYLSYLRMEATLIRMVNEVANKKREVSFLDLVGFYGYMGGYHEIVVHQGGVFDKGNAGTRFLRNLKLLRGVYHDKPRKNFFRSTLTLQNFCISYYMMLLSPKTVQDHFNQHKNDVFFLDNDCPPSIIRGEISALLEILEKNHANGFGAEIDTVYASMRKVTEACFGRYPKIIMETLAQLDSHSRIRQIQCRICQGPLIPARTSFSLYPRAEVVEYHANTDEIRKYFRL